MTKDGKVFGNTIEDESGLLPVAVKISIFIRIFFDLHGIQFSKLVNSCI